MQEIRKLSPESFSVRGDFAHPAAWEQLLALVEQRHQNFDGIVNCVGVLDMRRLECLQEHEIESIIRANFLSVIYGAQAALPIMRRQKKGVLITVGSLGGMVPMPHASLYSAAKYAVRGFSLSLSEELKGTGVEASLLTLGPVHTKMLEAEARGEDCVIAFINKPLSPERVADCIVSLLRDPQREMIVPAATGLLSKVCNVMPELFGLCYGILGWIGAFRLRRYRRQLTPLTSFSNWENSNVRTS